MKKNPYRLNIIFTVILGVALLALALMKIISPFSIRPHLSIPTMVLITVIALAINEYMGEKTKVEWPQAIIMALLAWMLFPLAAGIAAGAELVKIGIVGTAVFALTTLLFTSMSQRAIDHKRPLLLPLGNALLLYLASGVLNGML